MANPFDKNDAVLPGMDIGALTQQMPSYVPQQEEPQGPGKIQEFFKDPKNLATGLVFLAALAQGPRRGQNTAGQVGERALGAFAFRGGLDQGIRKQKIQDDEIAAQNLQRSRENEFRNRQVAIGEAGLGIQRDEQQIQREGQIRQSEDAKAQRGLSRDLADRPRPNTPEEAAYYRAHADLLNRTDPNLRSPGGAGTDKSLTGDEAVLEFTKAAWKAEIDRSTLAGTLPDPAVVAGQVARYKASMQVAEPGTVMTQNPDGSITLHVGAPPRDDVAPPGGGGGPPPPGGPGPQPYVPQPPATATATFGSGDVPVNLPPVKSHGNRSPQGGVTGLTLADITGIKKVPTPDLEKYLQDPRLTLDQLKLVRSEIVSRNARRKEGTAGYLK